MHTLYSKILFVGIGLLFAKSIAAQDTIMIGRECKDYLVLEQDNEFENEKLQEGTRLVCDSNGFIKSIIVYKDGKYSHEARISEVDYIMNKHLNDIKHNSILYTGKSFYKNGYFNGGKYIYDSNGLLERIEIYEEGKYVRDAQID